MSSRLWQAYLAAGVVAVVGYQVSGDARIQTGVIVGLTTATVLAIAWGARRHQPAARRFWNLLAVAIGIWGAAGWGTWQGYILATGSPPPSGSVADVFFLLGGALFVLALAQLAPGVTRGRGLLDSSIAAAGMFGLAWLALIGNYATNGRLPVRERVTQTGYAVVDVAVLAVAILAVVMHRRRTIAEWLLLGAAAGLLVADLSWNWLTFAGKYTAGTYVDLGWLPFLLLPGVAALHPSMASSAILQVDERKDERPAYAALLASALVLAPALAIRDIVVEGGVKRIVIDLLVVLVVALVLARIAMVLTHSNRLRTQLEDQNRRLQDLDLLKDEFVATVSHELRTPLTSIRGYAELLAEDDVGELNDDQREFVSVINRNSGRLLRLVGDLLFVARVDSGAFSVERTDTDLAEIVRDSVSASAPLAEDKGVRVLTRLVDSVPVLGDPTRLSQLVDNLLSNAVKFTPDGGEVTVVVEVEGALITLAVADTGIGMTAEDRAHLFERFFRSADASERAIQGTGLGLSIARAIAEAHGGRIDVRSELGMGTTFTVELPIGIGATKEVGSTVTVQ